MPKASAGISEPSSPVFVADLHIHSKYSRATSRECDLEPLAVAALEKGIGVVGCGDFTHPAWREELRANLREAEPGLYRLIPELERQATARSRAGGDSSVPRFMITGEISTIYKRDGRTRKVHHLLCLSSLEAAERLAARLDALGNIRSDGRPILGLDSRVLLGMLLESDPMGMLIPAHIWTPWFSVLGSMSGFDDPADCYGDLIGQIHALETGLSSDPPMNWRVSKLDRYRLVSFSDAHSPGKLGREATLFSSPLSYPGIREALKTGQGYGGTLEFFPEEGKYHLDGHRDCRVCWSPEETARHRGICPVCNQSVTMGVLNRVQALADRPEGAGPTAGAAPFESLVPLEECIAEALGVASVTSVKVRRLWEKMVRALGPELGILRQVPLEEVGRHGGERLAQGVGRMRQGEVVRQGGYDGVFGRIRMLEE